MTISTVISRVSFVGNGITTVFATPFPFFNDVDVRVQLVVDLTGVVTEQVLTTDFTLSGGVPTGSVTMLVAPPTGTTLVIFSDPALTQGVDLIDNDPLPVETSVERPLDKLTLLVQRSRDLLDRTSRLKDGDTGTTVPFELPLRSIRISQFAAWDASGDWIPASSQAPTTAVVTAFAETFLDDLDDAAVRLTLGVGAAIQNGTNIYALDTGTANAILMDLTPDVSAYAEGQKFRTHKLVTNTGAVTVDIDGVGATPLRAIDGSEFAAGQLAAGQPLEFVRHTSSEFRLTSVLPVVFASTVQAALKDPTLTRDTADSFTISAFQAAPLNSATPLVSTSGNLVRQITGLFERSAASAPKGISEQTGALAVAAEFIATDVSFTAANAIDAASGTPFSNFVAGDKIVVDGSSLNEGTFEIATLVGGGTGVTVVEAIVTESAGASITIYRVPQSSTLHLHAVRETATGNVAIAADDNKAGTNIGSGASVGWVQVRRLWSFLLNASTDIVDGVKVGNYWYHNVPQTFTPAIPVVVAVPLGIRVIALLSQGVETGAGANAGALSFITGATTPTAGLTSSDHIKIETLGGAPNPKAASGLSMMGTNTLGQVSYAITAGDTHTGSCQGYIDERKE